MESESVMESSVPAALRRIVTGHSEAGRSIIALDSAPPRTDAFRYIPGMVSRLIWATTANQQLPFDGVDPTPKLWSFVPAPGETRMLVITFPPDTVFASTEFDPGAAVAENLTVSPGLAELFEPDGMHKTPTVDFGVVLDGEIWLELDDGYETRLSCHDVFVQNGTRHAWRNKSERPATVAVVLIGAQVSE